MTSKTSLVGEIKKNKIENRATIAILGSVVLSFGFIYILNYLKIHLSNNQQLFIPLGYFFLLLIGFIIYSRNIKVSDTDIKDLIEQKKKDIAFSIETDKEQVESFTNRIAEIESEIEKALQQIKDLNSL